MSVRSMAHGPSSLVVGSVECTCCGRSVGAKAVGGYGVCSGRPNQPTRCSFVRVCFPIVR